MPAVLDTKETAQQVKARRGTPENVIATIRREYGLREQVPLLTIFYAACRCYHSPIDDERVDPDYARYEATQVLPYYMLRFSDPDVYGDQGMSECFRNYCAGTCH